VKFHLCELVLHLLSLCLLADLPQQDIGLTSLLDQLVYFLNIFYFGLFLDCVNFKAKFVPLNLDSPLNVIVNLFEFLDVLCAFLIFIVVNHWFECCLLLYVVRYRLQLLLLCFQLTRGVLALSLLNCLDCREKHLAVGFLLALPIYLRFFQQILNQLVDSAA